MEPQGIPAVPPRSHQKMHLLPERVVAEVLRRSKSSFAAQQKLCGAAKVLLPVFSAGSGPAANPQRVSTFTLNGIVLRGNFLHLLV